MILGKFLRDIRETVREWTVSGFLAGTGCLFLVAAVAGGGALAWAGMLGQRGWLPARFADRWSQWVEVFIGLAILLWLLALGAWLLRSLLGWARQIHRGDRNWGQVRRSLRDVGWGALALLAPALALLLPFLLLYALLRWLSSLPRLKLGELRREGRSVLTSVVGMVMGIVYVVFVFGLFFGIPVLLYWLGLAVVRALSWVF